MGRGRRGLLDDLAVLPWPVGLAVGMLGFAFIRYGIPAWASGQSGPLAQALSRTDAFAPLAWIVLAACAMASLFSWLDSRRKRRMLDAQTGLASIAALGCRDFERLVGEAFRRQGYTVEEETGLGGADGGIDLILRKNGQRMNVVREMYGLLAHHGAHAVQIATAGGFTPAAARFGQGERIALIGGGTLLAMLRAAQPRDTGPLPRIEPSMQAVGLTASFAPQRPHCGALMMERRNRGNGNVLLRMSGISVLQGRGDGNKSALLSTPCRR